MKLLDFLYHLKCSNVNIWKNDKGNLLFTYNKKTGFPDYIKGDLTRYKTELVEVLSFNDIDSEEKSRSTAFYKIPDLLMENTLSPFQRGIYIQSKLDIAKHTYNVPMFIHLKEVDISKLKKALLYFFTKHPIFRMSIYEDLKYKVLNIEEFEADEFEIETSEEENICKDRAKKQKFNLDGGKLVVVEIIKIKNSNDYLLNLTHHHILIDHYSLWLIASEILTAYSKLCAGEELDFHIAQSNRAINYFDYIAYQNYKLQSESYKSAISSLSNKLYNAEPLQLIKTNLIFDNQEESFDFKLSASIYKKIKQIAIDNCVSLYSILLTSLYKVLSIYAGNQINFPIGITVSNRPIELSDVIGPFINTLPLITDYNNEDIFIDNIRKVHKEVIFLNEYQQINLNILANKLKLSSHEVMDLMHVVFTMHNFKQEAQGIHNVNFKIIEHKEIAAKFGINIAAEETNEEILYHISYAKSLYAPSYIKAIFSCYVSLLSKIDNKILTIKTNKIQLLNENDYKQIIGKWNQTDKVYPENKTIHVLFEEQAYRTPNNIAVISQDTKLTYKELNTKANKLASYIRQIINIKPDTLIALFLDRSEHMLIAILAVLKAGGAYVPIDTNYPDERIKYILQDTHTPLILSNDIYEIRLELILNSLTSKIKKQKTTSINLLSIDNSKLQSTLAEYSAINPTNHTTSSNLAYVIYTSGTTGQPKGVMVEHKGVVNRINWMNNMYPLNKFDKVLQKTPYVFDVSVWELFWANWYGGCVVFAMPEKHRDTEYIINLLNKESITITHFVPSMLEPFIEALKTKVDLSAIKHNSLQNLRFLFCSGEVLSLHQVEKCSNTLETTEIYNLYGPTEASIDVLYFNCNDKNRKAIYIGKQIQNTTVYVLDDNLIPVPIGAIGELYIGGVGLARGYLNRPDLTAEKFIANPFQTEEEKNQSRNTRLYKTGDLVRWLPDGNLEYIGRNDSQVKIRGYRIELGEIESVLSSYAGVKQSVVLAKEHVDVEGVSTSNKYLVGYYVSDNKLNEEDIYNYLSSKLPEYMMPSFIVHVENIPLTINGKLDRKALPNPEFTKKESYIAPRNELERQVCEIWAEVLGLSVDKVGIQDDFFRLGGDSIISIQLVARLRKRLKLNVSIKDIFSYKCIEKIADNVLSKGLEKDTDLIVQTEEGILSGEVGLLPIQEMFFKWNVEVVNHYNQSFLLRVPELDLAKLQISIAKLIAHHDSFRLRFKRFKDSNSSNEDVYVQYYDPEAKVEELRALDIRTLKEKEGSKEFKEELNAILTKWQSNFDLEHGPMYSIGYIYGYKDNSSRIYFSLHHLIVDAVSWRILAEDLKDLYNGKELGLKGSSYRQWVETVRNYATTHEQEKDYWVNVLSDYDHNLINGSILIEDSENYTELQLSEEYTKQLLRECNRAYNTQINDILLTALGYALSGVTNSKVNHIILEGHGREEIDSTIDITRTVGWFTTVYPVRLEISEELGNSIKNIKETLRQIPNKGIGYGSLINYKGRSTILPRINFNYIGQFKQAAAPEMSQEHSKSMSQTNGIWNIVDEESGSSVHQSIKDYNIININSIIVGGILKFSIATRMDKNISIKFTKLFKQKLKEIIVHCMNKDSIEYTMSDFNDFEPYILFNAQDKDSRRMFIFPPGSGGIESYLNNIVPKLQNINLVLFNNYYTYLREKLGESYIRHITYEKLASEYISYIKLMQAKGPYNLFGWSFGGILAFEVARQLINRGDTVKNIILVDSYFNYKLAVLETKGQLSKADINYRYSPLLNGQMLNTMILLFRALKTAEPKVGLYSQSSIESEEVYKICKYYAENTKYNNLDNLLVKNNFKVIAMDHDHDSWLNDDLQIIKICDEIKSSLQG